MEEMIMTSTKQRRHEEKPKKEYEGIAKEMISGQWNTVNTVLVWTLDDRSSKAVIRCVLGELLLIPLIVALGTRGREAALVVPMNS